MATFDYEQAREDAEALIAEFGDAGQLILKGSAGGFDAFGNVTTDTADLIISGTVTPLIGYKTREINDTSIKRGDSYVFFHSTGEPAINMTIEIGGDTFRVIDIYKLDSVGGINVFTKLQLRK